MKRHFLAHTLPAISLLLLLTLPAAGAEAPAPAWLPALPGYAYEFPRDHGAHPDFKTEWWYFTGNLQDAGGHAYGYELTFFREGVLPPGSSARASSGTGDLRSRFVQNNFEFAHFAISDLGAGKFHFTAKSSRGAFDEAGFRASGSGNSEPRLAWLDDWTLTVEPDGAWHIRARSDQPEPMSIDLHLVTGKKPAIEGADGISRKAAGAGMASHYYSLTRLETTGTLAVGQGGAVAQTVHGESWFDHEWASNQLAPDQVGWDWFCCQFDDHTELMLYAMRRRDGIIDPISSGTLIDARGATTFLQRSEIVYQPLRTWHSSATDATYPIAWHVSIPSRQLDFTVEPRLESQELALRQISYWEGATRLAGTRAGRSLTGLGYMELTGYAGALQGLQAAPR